MSLLIDRAGARAGARRTRRWRRRCALLSDRHAGTVMLGRTLLQPAPPITFGLKAAGWFASLCRSWARVEQARRDAARVQLGGASGTLAALGDRGPEVADGAGARARAAAGRRRAVAHRARSARGAGRRLRDLRRRARQDRPRRQPADAVRGRRGARGGRRIVGDAAQAEPVGLRADAGRGGAPAGPRRDDAGRPRPGARTGRRRLAGRVARDRRGAAGHRRRARGDARRDRRPRGRSRAHARQPRRDAAARSSPSAS